MRRVRRGDLGSAAVEAAIVAPALFMMLMLVIYAGRMTDAQSQVQSAAHVAARAASQHNDPGQATAAAQAAARDNLSDGGITCTPADVVVATDEFAPGGKVHVTVSCDVDVAAVAMQGIPGTRHLTAEATEVIDRYRGTG